MTAVFADTSYFVAALNPGDGHHAAARAFTGSYTGKVVTTEFVLVELANFPSRPQLRSEFLELVGQLRGDSAVEIVPASAALFAEGLALFAARPDKDWSLTDCISFRVMSARGLTEALAADRHFAQAGFRPVLAP